MSNSMQIRKLISDVALNEVGLGDATKYWQEVLPNPPYPKAWCGAFALWCLKQVGLCHDWQWVIGKGFLFRLRQMPPTYKPLPGDILYFLHFQHHAVVVCPEEGPDPAEIHVVNGNGMNGRVTDSIVIHKTTCYSIESLITSYQTCFGCGSTKLRCDCSGGKCCPDCTHCAHEKGDN